MIYMILKKYEPINSCALESELIFNHNLNSNNDNKNNNSSSIQNGNNNNNDSNSNLNSEQYITLLNLFKKQELKWFSYNNEGIIPKQVHDTDTRFNLRYLKKNAIQLKPHSHTCIDLKIALEISATTIVQLASRSSLVKKKINIRREIIDAEYMGNIITILQNDSEKAYIIEPNKKIAQAIFLSLVKIAQLVLVGNRKKLKMTAREIQEFESIDVPVNMAEKKIVGKEEIISTCQLISILPYNQYILAIKKRVKNQAQIFEVETTICKSGKIGLTNFYIPVKSPKHIKIPIYNTTEDVIKIPKKTTIGYLSVEVDNQPPNTIPDFSQLCEYVDITSQTIYGQEKYYLFQPKQLEQMNLGNLNSLQQIQIKMLLSNFIDIFVSENEFGRTDII
ncbi:hypothetical protein G9A89_000402 [Geosiphon pyriformis]|nr:hypothetical protein G9A89_000402 [Geosiphon pyriformis]